MTSTILLGVDAAQDGRLAFERLLATNELFVDREFVDFDEALGAACECIQGVLDRHLTNAGVFGRSETQSPETAAYVASFLLAGLDAFVDWFGTDSHMSDTQPPGGNLATPVRFQLR